MSQQQLAEKINMTRPLISHIELTGKVKPETLQKISKALKIDLSADLIIAEDLKAHYSPVKQDIETYKAEISRLKSEIETLRELVESQKEVIRGLKENPGKRKYK